MTKKRYVKMIRAHITAYYLENRQSLKDWIGQGYRSICKPCTSDKFNYETCYQSIVKALPLKDNRN